MPAQSLPMTRNILTALILVIVALASVVAAFILQEARVALIGIVALLGAFYVWEKHSPDHEGHGHDHHHDLPTFEPKFTPEEAKALGLVVVQPSKVVAPAIQAVGPQAAYREVVIVDTLVRLMPDVYTDPVVASEVITALLARAIEVSPAGAEVIVHTEEGKDDLLFTIEDQGPGFDEITWTDMQKGSWPFPGVIEGIPFSEITQRIEKLHGALEVASEPGKGATFTLVIPKANELED